MHRNMSDFCVRYLCTKAGHTGIVASAPAVTDVVLLMKRFRLFWYGVRKHATFVNWFKYIISSNLKSFKYFKISEKLLLKKKVGRLICLFRI